MSNALHLFDSGLRTLQERLADIQAERAKLETSYEEQKNAVIRQYKSMYGDYVKLCDKVHGIWSDVQKCDVFSDGKLPEFLSKLCEEGNILELRRKLEFHKYYQI